MDDPVNRPFGSLELSGVGRVARIAFVIGVVIVAAGFFPGLNTVYEKHRWFQNLILGLAGGGGLVLAYLESRHSDEANRYRAEQIVLTKEANKFREVANRSRNETLELQVRVHQLQASIEQKLTKIRLYARVRMFNGDPRLEVSNLSEFDIWINQVELIVTEGSTGQPASQIIGGSNRISCGKTEDGYLLWGTLLTINFNQTAGINIKFHVKVLATGIGDLPETVVSPNYYLTAGTGNTKQLQVLE